MIFSTFHQNQLQALTTHILEDAKERLGAAAAKRDAARDTERRKQFCVDHGHYWSEGQCLHCYTWQPGEEERVIPVWAITYRSMGGKLITRKHSDLDDEIQVAASEGMLHELVIQELTMTQGAYAALDEFGGW